MSLGPLSTSLPIVTINNVAISRFPFTGKHYQMCCDLTNYRLNFAIIKIFPLRFCLKHLCGTLIAYY